MFLPKFLEWDALEAFDTNITVGDEHVRGFSSFPEAVNVFLTTYASDLFIEQAVREFESL